MGRQLVNSTIAQGCALAQAQGVERARAGWGGPSSVGDPCLVLRTPEAQREVPHHLRGVASHSLDKGHPVEVALLARGRLDFCWHAWN